MNKQDVFLLELLDNIDIHFQYLSYIYNFTFRDIRETLYLVVTPNFNLYIIIGWRTLNDYIRPGVILISFGNIIKLPRSNSLVNRFYLLLDKYWDSSHLDWLDLPFLTLYKKTMLTSKDENKFIEALSFYNAFPYTLVECSLRYDFNPLNLRPWVV